MKRLCAIAILVALAVPVWAALEAELSMRPKDADIPPTNAASKALQAGTGSPAQDHIAGVYPDGSTTCLNWIKRIPFDWASGVTASEVINYYTPTTAAGVVWRIGYACVGVGDSYSTATFYDMPNLNTTSQTGGLETKATASQQFPQQAACSNDDDLFIRLCRMGGDGNDTSTETAYLQGFVVKKP